jgi:NAD(P)H-hydrate epimerase
VAEGRAVLTPHEGELARLLGVTSAEIAADRYGFVARAARETKCIVLLKGPCTLIASPDGDILVNRTGSAALATAGAGDVLSGIIGALLCTLSPLEAAWVGAYLHGAAADLWAEENGDRGLLAHEVAERVPRVLANTLCVSRDAHGRVLNEKS